MIRQIVETTDGKHVGLRFDDAKIIVSPDGVPFHPDYIQDLGNGLVRYSNSSYVITTKGVIDGKDK